MDKREKLLATAIKLFVSQGFDNTPTSQISKVAGVATGTLFHHFPSKEDLINEAYIYAKKSLVSSISLDASADTKVQLHDVWFSLFSWAASHPDEVSFFGQFSSSPYITKLSKVKGKEVVEPITNVLRQGVKSGVLKDLPVELLSQICFSMMANFLCSKKLDKKSVNQGFVVLWDAIKK